jgi:hypothetical protein
MLSSGLLTENEVKHLACGWQAYTALRQAKKKRADAGAKHYSSPALTATPTCKAFIRVGAAG